MTQEEVEQLYNNQIEKARQNIGLLSGLICEGLELVMKGNREGKQINNLILNIERLETEITNLKEFLKKSVLN